MFNPIQYKLNWSTVIKILGFKFCDINSIQYFNKVLYLYNVTIRNHWKLQFAVIVIVLKYLPLILYLHITVLLNQINEKTFAIRNIYFLNISASAVWTNTQCVHCTIYYRENFLPINPFINLSLYYIKSCKTHQNRYWFLVSQSNASLLICVSSNLETFLHFNPL